jgi:hypothetical protein
MTILSALGLLVGGFLLVPKGMMIMLVIWLVAQVQPVIGVGLFVTWLVLERLL